MYTLLLYDLECVPLNNRELHLTANRLLMKLLKSLNTDIMNECTNFFAFQLPSKILQRKRETFNIQITNCSDMLSYFGLHKLN